MTVAGDVIMRTSNIIPALMELLVIEHFPLIIRDFTKLKCKPNEQARPCNSTDSKIVPHRGVEALNTFIIQIPV